jgi:uncharacterized membrane protein YbhN (UPF0104 family)
MPISLQATPKNRLRPSRLMILLGIVTTFVVVLLLASVFDPTKSLYAWQNLPIDSLLFCFLLIVASHIARSARIYHHFLPQTEGRFDICLRIALHHNFFNYLLPMRAGEASFPLLLRQQFSIDIAKSSAALLSFRLLDLTVLTLIGLLTLLSGLHLTGQLHLLLIVLLSVALFGLLLPILLLVLIKHWPELDSMITKIKQGMPGTPEELLKLSLWTILIWTIKLSAYALIIRVFIDSSLPLSLAAAVSGELASGIPLYTPAAIGTFEAGIATVLLPAGIDESTAFNAAVNLHLFLIVTTSLSAGIGLLIGNKSNVSR